MKMPILVCVFLCAVVLTGCPNNYDTDVTVVETGAVSVKAGSFSASKDGIEIGLGGILVKTKEELAGCYATIFGDANCDLVAQPSEILHSFCMPASGTQFASGNFHLAYVPGGSAPKLVQQTQLVFASGSNPYSSTTVLH